MPCSFCEIYNDEECVREVCAAEHRVYAITDKIVNLQAELKHSATGYCKEECSGCGSYNPQYEAADRMRTQLCIKALKQSLKEAKKALKVAIRLHAQHSIS